MMSYSPIRVLGRRCMLKGAAARGELRSLSTGMTGRSAETMGSSAKFLETVKEEDSPPPLEETTMEAVEEKSTAKTPLIRHFPTKSLLGTQSHASIERQKFLAECKYPRAKTVDSSIESDIAEINRKYTDLKPGDKLTDKNAIIMGRIIRSHSVSNKLFFFDVAHNGKKIQVALNFSIVGGTEDDFFKHGSALRRGDVVSVSGFIGRTETGDISIFATSNIEALAPCLHVVPLAIKDIEKRFQYRHVDLLINRRAHQTIRLRSDIVQYIRNFLLGKGFLEVQTPILADNAGGAAAKPFLTTSSVFREKNLALRIAPELWLKRLVIGGMEKIFEIGPQFRNENADSSHNPEFTTLEFYQAYASLQDLMAMTESLLSGLATNVNKLKEESYRELPLDEIEFSPPFRRIEFIPSLERAIGRPLPNLEVPEDATFKMRILYSDIGLELPAHPTLPRLLDRLSAVYLEPQCRLPTFITHQPECLSPLAKTTIKEGRRVSERFELFVQGREIVNAYEEENSPIEQRRKLVLQQMWKNMESAFPDRAKIESIADEAYVAALEWGLPPTGGFGMGIDRLCMLFSGTGSISDVLTFGSIRGVVGYGVAGTAAAIQRRENQTGQRERVITIQRRENQTEQTGGGVNIRRVIPQTSSIRNTPSSRDAANPRQETLSRMAKVTEGSCSGDSDRTEMPALETTNDLRAGSEGSPNAETTATNSALEEVATTQVPRARSIYETSTQVDHKSWLTAFGSRVGLKN